MPTNYITLTRQELYDLVWSKPMSSLAKEFGITDVGLAKRCRAVDVPIPYRGYWTRKKGGYGPPRTPLPKYRGAKPPVAKGHKTPRSLLPPAPEPHVPEEAISILKRDPPPAAKPIPPEHQALDERLRAHPATVRADLRGAHAAIRRTALHLKAQRVKDLDWNRGDRSGPIVLINVEKSSTQRALFIADAILRAADKLNWPFQEPPKDPDPYRPRYRDTPHYGPIWGCIMVEGEPLQITVRERQKQVPHVLTDYEKTSRARGYESHERPWDLAPTGDLRLSLARPDKHVFKTISDQARRRLEDKLPEVLHAMLEHALDEKRWREDRRRAEEAQRERERLENLARERHEAHLKLIAELERQAGAWYRARFLRRYVKAARRQLGGRSIEAKLQQEKVDFFEWAAGYLEQLDPLSATPHHRDQIPRQLPYVAEESALKNTLLRLFGHDGCVPRKMEAAISMGAFVAHDAKQGLEGND